jgi:hypothetical protein
MDTLILLGRTMGLSLTAGITPYGTAVAIGLVSRAGWVDLPDSLQVFAHDWIFWPALVLYVIEFFADKIAVVDSVWDVVHTLIRPVAGAVFAILSMDPATLEGALLTGLLGGSIAGTTHLTKAGTRAVVNTSPEPVSNVVVSFLENGLVVALLALAVALPYLAFFVAAAVIGLVLILLVWLYRRLRRLRGRIWREA